MQLDFDLRGAPQEKTPEPMVFTVGALTRRIRDLLESEMGEVWVEGEISNLRRQASGHIYFTLKDSTSQLACVLFAGQAAQIRDTNITDGIQVQIFGEVTVYESRGQYQIVVRNIQTKGAGALQAKFEALKGKLAAEGLFELSRKRPLPRFPQRVGVVTSPTGAAIRDFLNVLHRRHRGIGVFIYPVRVQGRGAAQEIARAIRDLGNPISLGLAPVDVIVVTRGGGSLEDLWEFNEEIVARAIAESSVPVVSAIGHEIDFTISDFVADMRAPTPSAAAEILSSDSAELLAHLAQLTIRLQRSIGARLETIREKIGHAQRTSLFLAPLRMLRELQQTFDRLRSDFDWTLQAEMQTRHRDLERAIVKIATHSPERRIAEALVFLRTSLDRMARTCDFSIIGMRAQLEKSAALVNALDPRASLARGYTLTFSEDGHVIQGASNLTEEDVLMTHFHDGCVRSVVKRAKDGK